MLLSARAICCLYGNVQTATVCICTRKVEVWRVISLLNVMSPAPDDLATAERSANQVVSRVRHDGKVQSFCTVGVAAASTVGVIRESVLC